MGHPRGTGFVKFKKREDAVKCVEVSEGKDGVFLDNRQLNILVAKEKGDVEAIQKERKEKEPKDNRNLYLAREGIIREGTAAAEGVSKTDMDRRKMVQKQKKQMCAKRPSQHEMHVQHQHATQAARHQRHQRRQRPQETCKIQPGRKHPPIRTAELA